MRALKQVSIAAAVLLLGASSAGAAGPYVGAHGGANWTHDGDIESEELSYELGYAAGASVGYKWDFNLRTELEATYRKNDFDELDTSFGSFDVEGDLSSWAFMVNAFYDFDTGTPWVPHLGIGLGLAVVTFDSAIEEDDTVAAFQIGAGIGYPLTPNLMASLDYRFFTTEDPEFEGVELEYRNSTLLAGLRYHF